MRQSAAEFFRSLEGKNIAFIGIAVTNTATIRQFADKGLSVEARDQRPREHFGELADELERLGVRTFFGEGYLEGLDGADVVFRTPGMPFSHPALSAARARGQVVTSEMEVFFDLCPCKTYAVTGSDGKTTTTSLIAALLERSGIRTHLGGNIGRALLPEIETIRPEDAAVVELSSFQLLGMRCAPDVAVVTNVAPNHLDVHRDMEEYIDAKRNIYLHQNAFSRTVLNADCEITRAMADGVRGRLLYFSLSGDTRDGAFLDADGFLCFAEKDGRIRRILYSDDILLRGRHNIDNFLAALCAVEGAVGGEAAREVAKTFGGVEHRLELVRELDGTLWYNASIASSPTRTIANLRSFDCPQILIAGGYDKKIPFEPLAPEIIDRVRVLILTGPTADKIETAVKSHPSYRVSKPEIVRARDLEAAVRKARDAARSGEVVLFSPACASFDAYPNFEARGRHFKELVRKL